MSSQPTVFHITHPKAGSQWVAEILKHCAPERAVPPKVQVAQFFQDPIKPGGLYMSVYAAKPEFDTVMAPIKHPHRKFVIIRDLRDTLVSLYFSLKVSHPLATAWHYNCREYLNFVDQEQGLLSLIGQEEDLLLNEKLDLLSLKDRLELANNPAKSVSLALMKTAVGYVANIQLSWRNDSETLSVRYEDLVTDEQAVFEQIVDYCQIDVSRQRLHNIVKHNSFEAVTGRKRGQEDVTAHQRKGIVGDWRNHFSERVKDKFKKRFGEVLTKTGYESDLNW